MAVPNIFGTATSAIPLSQLDQNFATAITLGNTAVYLGNTTTSLGNVTLTNVTISSGNVSVSTATVGAGSNTAPSITTTGDTNTGIFFPAADTIAFSEGGAEAMRIDSSGQVGIGTTSPSAPLHVQAITGGVAMRFTGRASPNDSYSDIAFYNNANTTLAAGIGAASSGLFLATALASPITFTTNNAEVGRFDSSGNLLVGTTSTAGTVVGARMFPTGLIQGTRSESTDAATQYDVYSTGAAAYRFYVGMGGTIFATSIVISAISDQRLKENVRDIDTGLDAIMALKPRRFDWKEGKGQDKKDVAGFIAQEFEDVFPECVSTSKAGADGIEYKNINHETLIPTLVKAIQEQQALITALTARITALEQA
jgi:hypothetical protein